MCKAKDVKKGLSSNRRILKILSESELIEYVVALAAH